ncbi:MAG: hypothetical protein JWP97_3929 [Labilithrix sp.]|nr:hypothetical protein [Labilithrix sp.]
MRTRALLALVPAIALAACGRYEPARFADRPVVTRVHDEYPINVPSREEYDERVYLSDVYLRRPLFDFVRPLEFGTAGDVNAIDEVPTSTWYDPDQAKHVAGPIEGRGPAFPLVALDETPMTDGDALVVRDARGLRYELLVDPEEHPGMLTAAEVMGAAMLRTLGFRTPPAFVVGVPDTLLAAEPRPGAGKRLAKWLARKTRLASGMRRVSATLWPNGVDVGFSPDFTRRPDDANDRVDHHNRRTLRALKIFAHWIGWTAFDVEATRDVYVGKPRDGHLVHYLVGTSRAFGTSDLQVHYVVDEEAGSEWSRFITFGLAPPQPKPVRLGPFPSVGYLPSELVPGQFDVSPPYSPFVRMTAPDEYWAGKRLVDVGERAIAEALAVAHLPVEATRYLASALETRRRQLIAHAMGVVTPLDPIATAGRVVSLWDRAILAGAATREGSVYEVSYLDERGREIAPRERIASDGEITGLVVPETLTSGTVALHVRAFRNEVAAPRWCDVHVVVGPDEVRVIGVRH